MATSEDYVSVPEFYENKTVFITGGAGYLGKVIIEKLLYSCPKIKRIYMLLRDSGKHSAEERYKEFMKLSIFDRLKAVRPLDLEKIVLVKGDIQLPNLNMTIKETNTLIEEVNVVIHGAASIKFTDPLDVALNINYEGTKNTINLCHLMKKLCVFVHISTAYTNTDKPISEEKVYPPPASMEEVYEFIKINGNNEKKLTKFLDGRPNTYVYTKALTEHLVSEIHGKIPTAIVRPSSVTPSVQDPAKGWVDNWFGPTGFAYIVGNGLSRAYLASKDNILDLIPVDYVSNLIITVAARVKQSDQVQVFNSCSGGSNPITLGNFSRCFIDTVVTAGTQITPYPFIIHTQSKVVLYLITLLYYAVGFIYDLWMALSFRKPRLTKMLTKATAVRNALEFFTIHSWVMKTTRTEALSSSLSDEDRRLFPFNPKEIPSWKEYIQIYYEGVMKYLINNKNVSEIN